MSDKTPLMAAVSKVVDRLDTDVSQEPVSSEEHQRLVKVERERERRARRNLQDRGRRLVLAQDAARLSRAIESGRAIRPLLALARHLSRRGVARLRRLVEDENPQIALSALRMEVEASKVIALLDFSRGRRAPRDRKPQRQIAASWPSEGDKT